VDRNLLRLAIFELLYQPKIPPKVVINEAVEMAKRYGSEASGAFVNGILDHIREAVGREV
jgi:transcription antitermination protein NusB